MFLDNKITSFNFNSVPEVFKKGWEQKHFCGRITLEFLQLKARRHMWFWLTSIIVGILLIVVGFAWLGSPASFSRFSPAWWVLILPFAAAISIMWWFGIWLVMPPAEVELMGDFVRDYEKLIRLIDGEWRYQYKYTTGEPGVRPTYENVLPFVERKLIELANQIKNVEDPTIDRSDCFGSLPDPNELRQEFGEKFDTLKPFGLVYPDYAPYFDPEHSYLYV